MSEKTRWYKYCGVDIWAQKQEKFKYLGQDKGCAVYSISHGLQADRYHVFESSKQELFISSDGPNTGEAPCIWRLIREQAIFGSLPRGTVFYINGNRGVVIGPGVAYIKEIGWSTMSYNLLVDVDDEVEADLTNIEAALEEAVNDV